MSEITYLFAIMPKVVLAYIMLNGNYASVDTPCKVKQHWSIEWVTV